MLFSGLSPAVSLVPSPRLLVALTWLFHVTQHTASGADLTFDPSTGSYPW